MPDTEPIERRAVRAIQNAIAVELGSGCKPGMEGVWHRGYGQNGDVLGQQAVQRSKPVVFREASRRREANDLSERMNARIRPSRGGHGDWRLDDLSDSGLDFGLNGRKARLNLPAVIARAVVLENQLKSAHGNNGNSYFFGVQIISGQRVGKVASCLFN